MDKNNLRERLKETQRLKDIEDRLKLAIETHEVFIEAMEADPYGDVVLTKKVALNFTLDILRDIKNGD